MWRYILSKVWEWYSLTLSRSETKAPAPWVILSYETKSERGRDSCWRNRFEGDKRERGVWVQMPPGLSARWPISKTDSHGFKIRIIARQARPDFRKFALSHILWNMFLPFYLESTFSLFPVRQKQDWHSIKIKTWYIYTTEIPPHWLTTPIFKSFSIIELF